MLEIRIRHLRCLNSNQSLDNSTKFGPFMPELPEVETTLRGIEPWLANQRIVQITVRQPSLRWPVTVGMATIVQGQLVLAVTRRAKYLIVELEYGSMLIHLGMSGSFV